MASKKNSKKKPAKAAKTAKATKTTAKAAKVKSKSAAPAAYKPRIEVGTTVEWSSQVRGEWNVKSGVVKKFLAENVDAWKHVPAKTLPSRVETRTPQSAHRRYLVASTDEKGNVHYYTPRCSTVDAWHFDEAPKSGPAKKTAKTAKAKAAPAADKKAAKSKKTAKAKAKAEPKKAAAKAKKADPAVAKKTAKKPAKAEIVMVAKKVKKAKAVAEVDTSEVTATVAADADHTDDSFTPGAAEA